MILPVENAESGLSVRNKINQLVDFVNTNDLPQAIEDINQAVSDAQDFANEAVASEISAATSADIATNQAELATTAAVAAEASAAAANVAKITWRGPWATGTAYALRDAVERNGSTYIVTVAHTAGSTTEPGNGASWTTVWDLLASKGAQGDIGPAGDGSGNVIGPISATDNRIPLFDGTTGTVIKDSGVAVVGGLLTGTVVTQSPTDTTAGRLLKVGDFGLGDIAVPAVAGISLDDPALPNGIYRFAPGISAGTSPTIDGFWLQLRRESGIRAHQLFFTQTQAAMHVRAWNGTAWTPWNAVITRQSMVGPVSQTGGVPTGAVIERGSNANGEFVRFADGTQICQQAVGSALTPNVAAGSIFSSPEYVWTFPAAFATTTIAVTCSPRNAADVWGRARVTSTTQGAAKLLSAVSVPTAIGIDLLAVGRWF
jgi:hypothetical protein